MVDRFLGTSGANANISNGTADIYGASLGAENLEASMPIKTNNVKRLISAKLDISDINNLQTILNSTITTPFTGTISATNFDTSVLGSSGKLTTSYVADNSDVSKINLSQYYSHLLRFVYLLNYLSK